MACNVNINSHPSYHLNFEQQFKTQTTTKVVHTLKQSCNQRVKNTLNVNHVFLKNKQFND